MDTPTRSRAQILDRYLVEVQTPDGELFKIMSDIAKYDSEDTKALIDRKHEQNLFKLKLMPSFEFDPCTDD